MRNNATEAEQFLWQRLKGKQLGVKFRRQHCVGNYIVDFYCPTLKLAIELEGSHHSEPEQLAYDQIRTEYLKSLGLKVIRYVNHSVLTQLDAVVTNIVDKTLPQSLT